MQLRIHLARAAGVTVALSLAATAASAQTDSTRVPVRKDRPATPSSVPVRKETPTPTPAPATPAPTAPAPTPAPMPAPPPPAATTTETTITTSTTTGETQPMPMMPMRRSMRFGNGVYLGLAAGLSSPRGGVARRVLEDNSNINGTASLGWDPEHSPLGLRLDVTYNRLNGSTYGPPSAIRNYDNSNMFSALADAKFRIPFGRFNNSTSGFYLIGGGGVHHIRNFQKFNEVVRVTTNEGVDVRQENATRFGVNGGAGFALGLGSTELFVESRYVRVFTAGRNLDYAPIVLGINIF